MSMINLTSIMAVSIIDIIFEASGMIVGAHAA